MDYFSGVPKLESRFMHKDAFFVRDEEEVLVEIKRKVKRGKKLSLVLVRFEAVVGVEAPTDDPERLQFVVKLYEYTLGVIKDVIERYGRSTLAEVCKSLRNLQLAQLYVANAHLHAQLPTMKTLVLMELVYARLFHN